MYRYIYVNKKGWRTSLAFFKKFCAKKFLWNFYRLIVEGGNKIDVYRRRLLISSIYHVKKWNIECSVQPLGCELPPFGPFIIDTLLATHSGSNHFYFP